MAASDLRDVFGATDDYVVDDAAVWTERWPEFVIASALQSWSAVFEPKSAGRAGDSRNASEYTR